VEDILDTGLTLNYISEVAAGRTSLEPCALTALLDKPSRRKQPIQAHYIGFAIPDAYVWDMDSTTRSVIAPTGYLRN